MSEVIKTGSTVDEAIRAAMDELEAGRDEVKIQVISPPSGDQKAEVRVIKIDPEERAKILEYAREDALEFLEGLLDAMELEGDVEAELVEGAVRASIEGEDLGLLIGRHGRNIDAVQELLRAAVQREAGQRLLITLDVSGYRERRREVVAELARDAASEALETGESQMEPMPAFERKVVHDTLAEIEGVSSESDGEEPRRFVVVTSESPVSPEATQPEEPESP